MKKTARRAGPARPSRAASQRRRSRSSRVVTPRPRSRSTAADGQADTAMVAGALFWGALLGEIARYAQATSRELKSLADARANPGQVLQRLSGLAQQYLASVATLPARLETGDGLAARGAGRSPRRQGRIIN